MEDLITELGPQAATLVGIVAALVQQLKRIPWIVGLQEKFPVYQVASLAFGIYGAYLFSIVNPVYAGALIGLASSGAFDIVKKNKKGSGL